MHGPAGTPKVLPDGRIKVVLPKGLFKDKDGELCIIDHDGVHFDPTKFEFVRRDIKGNKIAVIPHEKVEMARDENGDLCVFITLKKQP